MGIFDRAVESAKKVAATAQEGLAEAKDKGQGLVIKRKINGYAEEVGHLVFRQKSGEAGLDAEVDRLVSEMRAADAEIKALDES